MATINNAATLSRGKTGIMVASAAVETYENGCITMTKVIDNPGNLYFSGDPIMYTVTIKNTSKSTVTGLTFQDTLNSSIVPVSGTNYNVTTSSGTVSSSSSPISVTGITIAPSGTVTITISGKIA